MKARPGPGGRERGEGWGKRVERMELTLLSNVDLDDMKVTGEKKVMEIDIRWPIRIWTRPTLEHGWTLSHHWKDWA